MSRRTGARVVAAAGAVFGAFMSARAQTTGTPNRLARASSPYLLQHAHNPVDWYPWGPEAFEEARRRGVPIFLSVGYSTCYWCHVMERESFEDPAIARQMNGAFVCIKLDREERPDIDDIYMTAVQLMTQRGGWPMSVWLTPPGSRGPDDRGLEPFYAGTYFPAEPRHGMASFPQVLGGISTAWREQRAQVLEQAAQVTAALRQQLGSTKRIDHIGAEQVGHCVAVLMRIHDRTHGGFGDAPKFPQPVYLDFLLEVLDGIEDPAVRAGAERAARLTLDRMALGGMFDQVGGGFHRYSTDAQWLVPHFEKMLYDNALLASVYARSLARGKAAGAPDALDERTLRRTLDYVLREMRGEEGGFFSAQDAEVSGREGGNYLWTREELIAALGEEDGALAAKVFGADAGPNFRDPHHSDAPASNVLFLPERPEAMAQSLGMEPGALLSRLERIQSRLYDARQKREQPRLDDKVLAAWNGLMIAAMAEGAAALGEPRYLDAAERAAEFVLARMRAGDGSLLRSWRNGEAHTPAFLEDYAMMARGLLSIHRARLTLRLAPKDHIERAGRMIDHAFERFEDPANPGRLYDTLDGQSDLIVRTSATYDGAIPAGPGVMLNALIDLYELTGERAAIERAASVLAALSNAVHQSPVGSINATRGLHRLLRIDPALVDSIGEGNGIEAVRRLNDAPVQIFANADRVLVRPDAPSTLELELQISDGFHVTACDAGIEGLTPLNVRIEGGGGVRVRAECPAGEPYRGEALPEEEQGRLKVFTGRAAIRLLLERTGDGWSGTPLIVLTYQACDERACYRPITVELDVALDPG